MYKRELATILVEEGEPQVLGDVWLHLAATQQGYESAMLRDLITKVLGGEDAEPDFTE